MTTQSKTLEKDSFIEESMESFEATITQKSPNEFYLEKLSENYKKLEVSRRLLELSERKFKF